MTELVKLCPADEILDGDIKLAQLPDGSEIALYRVADTIYATADRCTHGDASLSEMGTLRGKIVECAFHSGTFDVTTGQPTGMPCEVPLQIYSVTLIGGYVHVEV